MGSASWRARLGGVCGIGFKRGGTGRLAPCRFYREVLWAVGLSKNFGDDTSVADFDRAVYEIAVVLVGGDAE